MRYQGVYEYTQRVAVLFQLGYFLLKLCIVFLEVVYRFQQDHVLVVCGIVRNRTGVLSLSACGFSLSRNLPRPCLLSFGPVFLAEASDRRSLLQAEPGMVAVLL